jgi:NAD-dependent dihydropyrimidine dehydrogenase PreA subunit
MNVTITCTGCGKCEDVCEHDAIQVMGMNAVINEEECIGCGTCKDACPVEAIEEN